MEEVEGIQGRVSKMRKSGLWDKEGREGKRIVRRTLNAWRKGRSERKEYRRVKKKYKRLCERKRRQKNERWERIVEEVRLEGQIWKIVNKDRRK